MSEFAELSKAVDRLVSGQEIEQLRYQFAHGIDRRDTDGFSQVWHDDATLTADGKTWQGIGDLMTYLTELNAHLPITHHYVVNEDVQIDGDRATGTCDHDIVAQDDSGHAYLVAATATDTFERRDGHWRISRRVIEVAHTVALDGATITAAQRDW
jgi:uncharacterized protein (TIGR02246 family)